MSGKAEDDRKPKSPKAQLKSKREQRLAASLRANLQKRKDQARRREAETDPSPE